MPRSLTATRRYRSLCHLSIRRPLADRDPGRSPARRVEEDDRHRSERDRDEREQGDRGDSPVIPHDRAHAQDCLRERQRSHDRSRRVESQQQAVREVITSTRHEHDTASFSRETHERGVENRHPNE
jgi:hypothetical protein